MKAFFKTVMLAMLLLYTGAASAADHPYLFRLLDAGSGLPENNVRSMLMLPDGLMCIQTASYLCFYDGASCRSFQWDRTRVPYSEYSGQCETSYDREEGLIYLKERDNVWAFDMSSSTFLYDVGTLPGGENGESGIQPGQGHSTSRTGTAYTSDGRRWFLSDKSIMSYDPKVGGVSEWESIPPSSDDLFTSLAVDGHDNVWIGSARSGVRICHPDGSVDHLPYMETVRGRKVYQHTDISHIYADPKGGIWIATQSEGLLYWREDILRFKTVNRSSISSGSMPDESVKCLAETKDGKVLVGTIEGLLLYDPASNSMSVPYPQLHNALVISLFVDKAGRVWAGTFYDGLYCFDGGRMRHWFDGGLESVDVSYLNSTPNSNCVRALTEAPDGTLWISIYGGVGTFDPVSGSITLLRERHPELAEYRVVRSLSFDGEGILNAFGDSGHFIYDPSSDKVLDHCSINHDQTQEGIIMSRVTDDSGAVWSAFSNRITMEKETGDGVLKVVFDADDGISCGALLEQSALKHSDGHLYFGGTVGFCIIDPGKSIPGGYGLRPVVSSVKVRGEQRPFMGGLTLRHNETDISLEFSDCNYANPSLSVYRYRLEGFEKEWHIISSQAQGLAAYTFLRPGHYTFEVESSTGGTAWGETTEIPIEVKPPFYASLFAKVLYILLALAAATGLWLAMYNRNRKQLARQAEAEEQKRQEELNQMKFRFFTNVSHELRTPLSLIILPLESLMKDKEGSDEYPKLETMHRNAKDLLTLVNHLLDFRKLEMGGEKAQLRAGNFSEFVVNVLDAFRDAAARKNISLSVTDETDNPIMQFDSSMMQKVVNNLMSNALKFTPEGGAVRVRLNNAPDNQIRLEVEDSGIGIPAEEVESIFDRFYRSSNAASATGSGIGLSLVKQYVELHGGKVSVSSVQGKGSLFTVLLPAMVSADELDGSEKPSAVSDGRKKIMVVDDNADFRRYLRDELSRDYAVTDASDGVDCLSKLPDLQPDMVISDVMMPGMNGFELTKRIKEDISTSHIPVILLSARMSEDVRTEGYEYGADAYLTKPFRMEMLQARIKNLLEEREKRIRSFSTKAEVSPTHVTITTVDQKLMARITEKLEPNMDNPDYSVEQLASDVGMHRMNLYRKIQSLYGMTPSEFIRAMRLKRAAQILGDDPNLNVIEVAEMVGFGTTKYFTKYFKEMFGVLPSQYKKK